MCILRYYYPLRNTGRHLKHWTKKAIDNFVTLTFDSNFHYPITTIKYDNNNNNNNTSCFVYRSLVWRYPPVGRPHNFVYTDGCNRGCTISITRIVAINVSYFRRVFTWSVDTQNRMTFAIHAIIIKRPVCEYNSKYDFNDKSLLQNNSIPMFVCVPFEYSVFSLNLDIVH